MSLQYNTENKRILLGGTSSPPSENQENKRIGIIYKSTDSEGNRIYLRSTDVEGVYSIVSDEEIPEILTETKILEIDGVSKDPSGDFYVDTTKIRN